MRARDFRPPVPVQPLMHVLVLLAYAVAGFHAALVLTRRRLLS